MSAMTPKARAERLMELYRLRAQVADQIANLTAALERDVNQLRRVQAFANKPYAECGTDPGYYRHRRTLKEPSCEACKLAHSAAERVRSQARKAKSA